MGEKEQPFEMKTSRKLGILLVLWILGGIWYVYNGVVNIESNFWIVGLGLGGEMHAMAGADLFVWTGILLVGIFMILQPFFIWKQGSVHKYATVSTILAFAGFLFSHIFWALILSLEVDWAEWFGLYSDTNYWLFFLLSLLINFGIVLLGLGTFTGDHGKKDAKLWLKEAAKIEQATTIEPAIPALKHRDVTVRRNASKVLVKRGNAKAVEPLIKALNDKAMEVRKNASRELVYIKDPRAVDPLIRALRDSCAEVRSNAAWALNYIGDKRAVYPLIQALKDNDAPVRRLAASALGEIRDSSAVNPLRQALNDFDDKVRLRAAEALAKIEPEYRRLP